MMQENELTMMAKALDEKEKTISFLREKLDIKSADYDQLVQTKNLIFSDLERLKLDSHHKITELQSVHNNKAIDDQIRFKNQDNKTV